MTAAESFPVAGAAPQLQRVLTGAATAVWMAVAIGSFHAAYLVPAIAWLMVLFLVALLKLAHAPTARWAFYPGLIVGIGCYAPQLAFFWGIFGPVAISLWTIIAIWIGFFVLMAWSLKRVGFVAERPWLWIAAVPMFWTGIEYFRCELYYLKFAWLTPGIAISASPWGGSPLVAWLGVYGAGLIVALAASVIESGIYKRMHRFSLVTIICFVMLAALVIAIMLPAVGHTRWPIPRKALFVGIQLEGPSVSEVVQSLDAAVARYPDVALLVMSEYTLDSPPPNAIKAWCEEHQKYLVVGGKQPLDDSPTGKSLWADTAFVVGPSGEVVFSQGKSVPIQFFEDGVPAKEQRLWNSPWGKIGICICYDLSYTRVTDELIRQGAEILIVPTMDANKWGAYEHALHARIAPVRAKEYHVQIMRVGSSGISQIVGGGGNILASAPFPGQGEMLAYQISYRRGVASQGALPPDRIAAPFCVAATALIAAALIARRILVRFDHSTHGLPARP